MPTPRTSRKSTGKPKTGSARKSAPKAGGGLMGWLGRQVGHVKKAVKTDVTKSQTAKRPPNHVVIDRLAGKDIAVRRAKKDGTTMIWVNHEVERSGW